MMVNNNSSRFCLVITNIMYQMEPITCRDMITILANKQIIAALDEVIVIMLNKNDNIGYHCRCSGL